MVSGKTRNPDAVTIGLLRRSNRPRVKKRDKK